MRRDAKRARKSELPQERAVSRPNKIPMRNYEEGLRSGGLAFLYFQAENGHHFLQIFPDVALGGRISQQIRGMIGGHQFSAAKFQPLAAKMRNAAVGFAASVCAAHAPRHTITFGSRASSWRIKYGEQVLISSGSGRRFSGGRHFTTLQMYTSLRCKPIASIICVSNFPARPTKGSPWASSSRPGPSPTKTRSALGLPSPKTILFLVVCSLQRVHSPRSSRILSSESSATLFEGVEQGNLRRYWQNADLRSHWAGDGCSRRQDRLRRSLGQRFLLRIRDG